MFYNSFDCGQLQKDYESGNYELLLCERCKGEGYCRKLAGENIEPYYPMKIDEEEFRNIMPLRIPREKQGTNEFLMLLNEFLELFHCKEYEKSLVIFRELYQQNPTNEVVTYGVACCCYFLDDFESKTYQDFPKNKFLCLLEVSFCKFKGLGDDKPIACMGYCGSKICGNFKMPGYRFKGNNLGAYINLIFKYNDTGLNYICECNGFACKRSNLNPETVYSLTLLSMVLTLIQIISQINHTK